MLSNFLTVTPAPVDFSAITNALSGSVNVGTIGTVIGVVLGSGVGLAIFWWGGRKIINGVMSAFKTGKLKF